jgi:hypothetical protein
VLDFTSHSTPRPQAPVQHPPATGSADRSQTLNILPFYTEEDIPQHNSIIPPANPLLTRPDSLELSDISEINSDLLNDLAADDADVEIQTAIRLTNTVIEERSRLFDEINDLRQDLAALQRCHRVRNMESRTERLQPNLDSVRSRVSIDDNRPQPIRLDDEAMRVPPRDTMHLPPTDFSCRPRTARTFPSAPINTPNRTINPAAAAFKPEPFNGRNTFNANNWWQKFKMYTDLAQVDETLHCSILRLLLVGDAETWYNSLTNETQNNFRQLEEAFKNQYIDPISNKFAMLSDLRVRVQGHHESLRTFLTEAGARLKAMGYPRELWLDLIYPAAMSAINAAQLLPFQNQDTSLMESIDKLQASIARLNVESPQTNNNNQRDSRPRSRQQFDRPSNKSPNFNQPPRCFYCNITGHIQRDCRKKRNDMNRRRNFSNTNNYQRRVTFQDQRPPFRGRPQNRGFSGYNDNRQFSGDNNRSPYRRNFSPFNQRNFNNNQYTRNNSASPREN